MKRMNLGAGSVQPDGWINTDKDSDLFWEADGHYLDVTSRNFQAVIEREKWTGFDYIVCNHMLSDLDWHELPGALKNIRSMLKPGGVFRALVPDVMAMFDAYRRGDASWFPQDESTPGLDQKFCTLVTWYGSVKSVFTPIYLAELFFDAGFLGIDFPPMHTSLRAIEGLTDLDGDRTTCMVIEAVR